MFSRFKKKRTENGPDRAPYVPPAQPRLALDMRPSDVPDGYVALDTVVMVRWGTHSELTEDVLTFDILTESDRPPITSYEIALGIAHICTKRIGDSLGQLRTAERERVEYLAQQERDAYPLMQAELGIAANLSEVNPEVHVEDCPVEDGGWLEVPEDKGGWDWAEKAFPPVGHAVPCGDVGCVECYQALRRPDEEAASE